MDTVAPTMELLTNDKMIVITVQIVKLIIFFSEKISVENVR